MKRLLQFFTLLTLALVGGAQTVLALTETTQTYEFENGEQPFVSVAGAGGATRISLSVAQPSNWNSKVVEFAAAGNATNGSAASSFDFSSLTSKAVQIKIDFDCFLGDQNSGTISIGDNTRNIAGSSGTWGYNATGAIWSIGINRGKLDGKNNSNNIRINGTDLGLDYNTYLKEWMHIQLTVDLSNKKVTYMVTKQADNTEIASGTDVNFVSDVSSCTQIDLFSGTNNAKYYIDNLSITSCVDETQKYYDYTIKYIYEEDGTETEIKTASTGNGAEGATAEISSTDKESIMYNDEKYIYVSDDASDVVISEGSVVKVKFRKAALYNYTVQNSFGETLATGSSFEGDLAYATYPQYVNVDGILYEASKGNVGFYKCSFTPTANNYAHVVEYKKTAIDNVVYFSEAEDIEGMEKASASNSDIRCSNGVGGYNKNDIVTATTLQPGKYTIKTVVWGTKDHTVTIKAGDATIHTATTTGSIAPKESNFELIKEEAITIEGALNNAPLDYVYIIRTGDATLSIDLPADYTYSTFCSTKALDFTDNADVEAYIAQVENDGVTVTLTKVNQVPAGEGVILKKTGDNTTAAVKVLASAEALSNNALVGVTEANTVSLETLAVAGNAYVLVSDEKFSKVSEGASGYISAGKAYLEYTPVAGASVNSLRISFGEPTAVADVEAKLETGDNAIYNVQGIRVSKPTAPGMYIMNGKAFIVK